MKNYNKLTNKGKLQRCRKAINILFTNHKCGYNNNILDKYNRVMDEYNNYNDNYNNYNIEQLRNEILIENKYRGYTNYCPLEIIVKLLG